MAGKKDIVEQALKLVMGAGEEAAPKAAIRAYHVSPHDFDVFKPSEFRGSTFFSSTPERAKRGAEAGRNEMVMETATELPPVNWRTYEVEIDPSRVKGLSLTPSENEWFESLPGKIVGDDALAEATKGIPPGMYWDDFYDETPVAEGVYEYIKKPTPPSISYEDAISKNRDIYHRQWPHYAGAATDEKSSASRLNEQGMGGYLVQDEGGLSFAINDPSIVKILRKYAKGGSIRQGYGPGGWVDDVVRMAGKVISGEGEDAAKAGIRAYQGSPHNFAAERLVRFPEGRTEYIVGQPDVLPDVPQGAEVLQDFPLGRMRMDKIGTGEGAQAYGHGLYYAEHEPIARHYRQALSGAPTVQYKGDDYALPAALSELKEWRAANPEGSAYLEGLRKKTMEDAAKILLENVGGGSDAPGVLRNLVNSFPSAAQDTAKGWVEQAEKLIKPHLAVNEPGHVYEVNIAANPEQFLDWDKPLSEQSPQVRSILEDSFPSRFDDPRTPTGQGLYKELTRDMGRIGTGDQRPEAFISEVLNAKGIPGIKYLDAGSRYTPANLPNNPIANEARQFLDAAQGNSERALQLFRDSNPVDRWAGPERDEITKVIKAAAKPVTRNYVVFDDSLISIVRKYGIAGASAMLGYNLMEQLDPKQALAASMADQDYQASRPQRSMGGNNSISGALNVARGLNGVK